MTSRARRSILAFVLGLSIAAAAEAAQYPAWGDTGWVHANKRECCDDAIAIAQDYSASACLTTGGMPKPMTGGGRRGVCTSEWMQDTDGSMLYRCYGEAAVWCR